MRPEDITRQAAEEWRTRATTQGTGFRPPGAKATSKAVDGRSGASFNKAFDCLRKMLDMAVDMGALHANPLAGRKGLKAKVNSKKPDLPETAKLHQVFAAIEASGELGGWAVETADFCRFLAFTGCRLAEAGGVTLGDIDDARGLIRVRGTKTKEADREVPMIPAARELIAKIRARRERAGLTGGDTPFLLVKEAQGSLTRACRAAGAPRLTHHDLRDAFATQAIEAGVDIPTVAGWLGHADGGALLMRTYAHHRRAHSVAQAAKVDFGAPVVSQQAPGPQQAP